MPARGAALWGMPAAVRTPAFCTQCRSRCGCIAVVEDGRLDGIEPLPGHPTGDKLCPKGRAAPELVYHADRLTHPLRRTAPKGAADPGWRRISWDEALGEIASRMAAIRAKHGPEQVAFSATTPSGSHLSDSHCLDRALHPRLRQPQHHLRDRDLQLAQGFRLAIHVRHRYRHARLRPHRLRAAVGQQPRHHLARAGDRGAEGGQARRAHDRGRPAGPPPSPSARTSGCRCAPAPTRRSRSGSPT